MQNKIYRELQKRVYKIIYNGEVPPLEFGCKILYKKQEQFSREEEYTITFCYDAVLDYIDPDSKESSSVKVLSLQSCRFLDEELRVHKSGKEYNGKDYKILGKELTLSNLLLAIEIQRKPNSFKFDIDTKGYMTKYDFMRNPLDQWDFDLSKPIKNQDPVTIQKLLDLIDNK